MSSTAAVLAMGFVMGLSHATDSDHVVAVSTIVARERKVVAAARIGVLWGLGHSAMVLLAGGAMVASGVVLPERPAQALEMAVAAMLVVLGVMGVRRALAAVRTGHVHARVAPGASSSIRPIVIGLVHGLAGSAALALAILATVDSRSTAIGYLALFCVGTVAGMSLVTAALSAPLAIAAGRVGPGALRRVALASGGLSIGFGVWLAYRVGVEEGLLLGVARAALP
jgi:high-affinity nickel permease